MFTKPFVAVTILGGIADASSKWAFAWPYGAYTGECKCVESEFGKFKTESSCMNAFGRDRMETCVNGNNDPFSHSQCDFIVSTSSDVSNENCKNWCSSLSEGHSIKSYSSMMNKCSFEFYRIDPVSSFSSSPFISTDPSSCFDNYLYGYGDTEPSSMSDSSIPLVSVIEHIPDAQSCQLECQNNDHCERWSLRLLEDSVTANASSTSSWPFITQYTKPSSDNQSFVHPVYSCTLYSRAAVAGALAVSVDSTLILSDKQSKFCDLNRAATCPTAFEGFAAHSASPCLVCKESAVCAFKSAAHISGPKFCSVGSQNEESKCSLSVVKNNQNKNYEDEDEVQMTEAETTTGMYTTESDRTTTGLVFSVKA